MRLHLARWDGTPATGDPMTTIDLVAIENMREHLQCLEPWRVQWFDALRIEDQAILANARRDTIELNADTAKWRQEMGYRPDGGD